jgi:hypothetical protein
MWSARSAVGSEHMESVAIVSFRLKRHDRLTALYMTHFCAVDGIGESKPTCEYVGRVSRTVWPAYTCTKSMCTIFFFYATAICVDNGCSIPLHVVWGKCLNSVFKYRSELWVTCRRAINTHVKSTRRYVVVTSLFHIPKL